MAKVWLVTTGEYSDYKVRGVFDDRGKADAFLAAVRGSYDDASDRQIEEFELNATPAWHQLGMEQFMVSFAVDGNVACAEGEQSDYDKADDVPIVVPHHDGTMSILGIWAKDRDAAIKIASEKRREHLALHPIPQNS